jgi:hypothetical protein
MDTEQPKSMPEQPVVETYEQIEEVNGTEVRFSYKAVPERGGSIRWTVEWEDEEKSGYSKELREDHGALVFRRSQTINGTTLDGKKLRDEQFDSLQDDLREMQHYVNQKREAERQQKLAEDLTLTIKEITYKTGTHRTKYTRKARVLVPHKNARHWREEEEVRMEALSIELGDADGKPLAESRDEDANNPFESLDEGTELMLSEAIERVDGIDEVIEDVVSTRETREALEELHEEYPVLRDTNASPDEVEQAFEEAEETGEPVTVTTGTAPCNDRNKECNLDNLRYRATPDGEIEVNRTHTY